MKLKKCHPNNIHMFHENQRKHLEFSPAHPLLVSNKLAKDGSNYRQQILLAPYHFDELLQVSNPMDTDIFHRNDQRGTHRLTHFWWTTTLRLTRWFNLHFNMEANAWQVIGMNMHGLSAGLISMFTWWYRDTLREPHPERAIKQHVVLFEDASYISELIHGIKDFCGTQLKPVMA